METLLEVLEAHSSQLGPPLGQTAFKRGLAVTNRDGTRLAIPISLTPVVLAGDELNRRMRLTRHICSAAAKMARTLLASERREWLLSALSPLERKIAERSSAQVQVLANTRADFFVSGGQPFALEVNATIPAMQGYSDIAANAFIETVGQFFGLSQSEQNSLMLENGSNARALFEALLAGAEREKRKVRTIGILCRRNDAQLSELEYLSDRFNAFGVEAVICFPDELELSEKEVAARGRQLDVIYRHLFVRRLEESPAPAVEQLLMRWPSVPVTLLNPPASQVEVKTTFAFLSEASVDPALASEAKLNDDELESIAKAVPWTRALRPGPATISNGGRTEELVEFVAANPDQFVIKRAWDYGGKAVFVGAARNEESFRGRVEAAYGLALDWATLCRRASRDPTGGGFIVQTLVRTRAETHILCAQDVIARAELFVDFSAYASVGLNPPPWGGVCRGSTAQVVNIVGGGGVLPLLTGSVASALTDAARRRFG